MNWIDQIKIVFPATTFKTLLTRQFTGMGGNKVTAGMSNEGLELLPWIQKRIDDGDLLITAGGITDLGVNIDVDKHMVITSSTGSDVILTNATSVADGTMSYRDKQDLDATVSLIADLGTFTGTTISDNTDLVSALQELETAVENISGATNLSTTLGTTTVTINSDTGTSAIIPAATTSDAGIMSYLDKSKLDILWGAIGVASSNMGTFTGSIITDYTTAKQALQELETAIEAIPGADGNGLYSGNGNIGTVTASLTDVLTFQGSDPAHGFIIDINGGVYGTTTYNNVDYIRQSYTDAGGVNYMQVDSSGIKLNTGSGDRVTITGSDARYAADYSSTYDVRSLVDKAYVDGKVISYTPTSTADSAGTTGTIAYDTSYLYIKTGSGWYRTALSSF